MHEKSSIMLLRNTCLTAWIIFFPDKNAQAQKRALPALAAGVLKNPAVQKAVVDKGLDVMNQLVDKQLRIIDEAQEKASKFLAKEASVQKL